MILVDFSGKPRASHFRSAGMLPAHVGFCFQVLSHLKVWFLCVLLSPRLAQESQHPLQLLAASREMERDWHSVHT